MLGTMPLEQAHLLIVDDDPIVAVLVGETLNSVGYRHITTLLDPREVIPLLKRERIDLIVMDLEMPHLNGFQLMEEIRTLDFDPPIPILVETVHADRATRLRALDSGASDFVSKPVDSSELKVRVKNLLRGHLLHLALQNSNQALEQRVRKRTEELEATQLEIILRLGKAAEFRDNETGNHILRMSHYARLLSEALGQPHEFCERVFRASPMHDVGKIGIPDDILFKPGELTAEEWKIMRTHPEIGAQLLSGHPAPLLETAREIALTHHEKWDGSGYPYGLKGEAIPLSGRIVALADVFDALTSSRPYKEAWPFAEALDYIEQERGHHFEPALVDLLPQVIDSFAKIHAQYQDIPPSTPPTNGPHRGISAKGA